MGWIGGCLPPRLFLLIKTSSCYVVDFQSPSFGFFIFEHFNIRSPPSNLGFTFLQAVYLLCLSAVAYPLWLIHCSLSTVAYPRYLIHCGLSTMAYPL